jgi:hypothetical protein
MEDRNDSRKQLLTTLVAVLWPDRGSVLRCYVVTLIVLVPLATVLDRLGVKRLLVGLLMVVLAPPIHLSVQLILLGMGVLRERMDASSAKPRLEDSAPSARAAAAKA